MPLRVALIPSPFVGANAWEPVAEISPEFVPVNYGGVSGPDWYEGVADRVAEQVDDGPWMAVLHSGAGGFAPGLAARARNLSGLVFVDAMLPYPGRSWLETVPGGLAERLRGVANDGVLPPWNTWFPTDPTVRLIPEQAAREAFIRGLPQVPFAFVEARSPDVAGWQNLPIAYLQLSGPYDHETAQARVRAWPTETAKLNHLAIVGKPVAVAELVANRRAAGTDCGSCRKVRVFIMTRGSAFR